MKIRLCGQTNLCARIAIIAIAIVCICLAIVCICLYHNATYCNRDYPELPIYCFDDCPISGQCTIALCRYYRNTEDAFEHIDTRFAITNNGVFGLLSQRAVLYSNKTTTYYDLPILLKQLPKDFTIQPYSHDKYFVRFTNSQGDPTVIMVTVNSNTVDASIISHATDVRSNSDSDICAIRTQDCILVQRHGKVLRRIPGTPSRWDIDGNNHLYLSGDSQTVILTNYVNGRSRYIHRPHSNILRPYSYYYFDFGLIPSKQLIIVDVRGCGFQMADNKLLVYDYGGKLITEIPGVLYPYQPYYYLSTSQIENLHYANTEMGKYNNRQH